MPRTLCQQPTAATISPDALTRFLRQLEDAHTALLACLPALTTGQVAEQMRATRVVMVLGSGIAGNIGDLARSVHAAERPIVRAARDRNEE